MTVGAGFIPKFATAITFRIGQPFAIAVDALMLFAGISRWYLRRVAAERATTSCALATRSFTSGSMA